MSSKANARTKGKGWFVAPNGYVYVQGSVDGKFERKSWGKKHSVKNEKYIAKHHREVLLGLVDKDKQEVSNDFSTFSRDVILAGVKKAGKKGGRSELAQREALSKLERLILPYFKSFKIDEIKVMHVEKWVEQLLKKYSTSTVSKCVDLLRAVMHKACANDIIVKNPVEYIDKIEVVHEKQYAYSVADARKMMSESTGFIHTYLNLAFATGMRTGELMALMWEDVDFERGVIFLQRSVTKGFMSIGSNGNKNHKRLIPVMPDALAILKKAKEESSSIWIFPSRKGEYYKESKSITNAYFKPLLEELGIEYISLYATRHTFSTVADNLRVEDETINSMSGNSKKVRDAHYNTFEMTDERAAEAHRGLSAINNAFFGDRKVEIK